MVPVWGIDRLEILRDGASAIYGADAVSGVVNNVLQTDYEGFQFRTKIGSYEHFDATDKTFTAKWGTNFNDDRGNISVFVDYYDRDSINSSEDPRWGNSDHRMWTTCDLPDGVSADGRCLDEEVLGQEVHHLEIIVPITCMDSSIWLSQVSTEAVIH